ncbi:MAG TPA: sialidase family protein [Candidatus Eisenbacteria bacterium]|nr:sialidase family protein [Candidatus Eisenbacteria bacterium]
MRRLQFGVLIAIGGLLLPTLVIPTPARAAKARVRVLREISGPSPFAPDGCGLGTTDQGAEYTPELMVNPVRRRNLIAIYSQDDEISTVVSASRDGGRRWTQVLVPGLSRCTGGTYSNAFDPDVAIGPDGIAYLSSAVSEGNPSSWSLLVNASTDGGFSWSDPVTIDRQGPFPFAAVDLPVITANPYVPRTAYLVWNQILFLQLRSPQLFSRTTDGGTTWTPPAMIPITPQADLDPIASQIRVLPDGTLVDVFDQVRVANPLSGPVGPTGVWVARSTDQGDTWSDPIHVADIPANVLTDPDSGTGLGRGNSWQVASVAVGADGALYVAWHLIESTSSSRILFVKSVDGGLTWTDPGPVAVETTQAFKPTIAVSPTGLVGVTYFDFRNDVPGDQELTTDLWFRHSHDGGTTWSETHVAGPFDLRPAPSPGAFPLGDYFGLVPIGRNGFGAVWTQTLVSQTDGVTDTFYARLRVSRGR